MKKIKPMMIASLTLVIIVSLLFAVNPTTAEESDEQIGDNEQSEPLPTVSITGSATIQVPPDQMAISLKIETNDLNSAATAKDKAAVIIDKVINNLKGLGLTEDDIETTSYNIQPRYDWEEINGDNNKVFKGYFVIVKMKITLKNFDKSGKVIDVAVDAGSLVDNIQFELSLEKREQLKTQVYADAATDAKVKANAIAEALGYELGDVKSVSVNSYNYQPRLYYEGKSSVDFALPSINVVPTTILPGDLTLSGSANIVFEIQK